MINIFLKKLVQIRHYRYFNNSKFLLNILAGLIAITIVSLGVDACKAINTPYIDPVQFTSVPFGSQSHWLQPWRAYMETVPAASFLRGVGINWNVNNSANADLVAAMLAKHSIHGARVEIGWGDIDFSDETKLLPSKAAEHRAKLLALKKYQVRPLLLLNAHHGLPCPAQVFERTLVANARAGDLQVQLNDVSGLKIGYSGLSNLSEYWAGEALITKITDKTITLSKPLPKDIAAGTALPMVTLKYRPFSVPGSSDYQATMAGWKRYVETVDKFVTEVLGTAQSSDKGFDLEIWNELSFGSNFLSINHYYAQPPSKYEEDSIWTNLVKETSAYLEAHSQDFQGVLLVNGFSNTIPWPASSLQPARIHAIAKHPYAGRKNYPQSQARNTSINALSQEDKSGFVPKYSALFPEYFATALQTETIVRDMGPIASDIYGTKHGRYARAINGKVVPTPVWITEVNMSPEEDNPNISAERALAIKAKTTARYVCFYLNKGAEKVYLYAAAGGDKGLGIVKQSFLDYAEHSGVYPSDEASYTSPALAGLARIADKMRSDLDNNLKSTRELKIVSISDPRDRYQFAGQGTTAHPNLYNRDVFTFLPFQVNEQRFVVPYYVMTRDVTQDLTPEDFTVQIQGLKGSGASVSAYDPLKNRTVPVVVKNRSADSLSVILTATDYPYLLTVQEAK